MPQIDLSFRGYLRNINVNKAVNVDGQVVDVTSWPAAKVCKALEEGELFISLGDHLYQTSKGSISMDDFQPSL